MRVRADKEDSNPNFAGFSGFCRIFSTENRHIDSGAIRNINDRGKPVEFTSLSGTRGGR